MNKIKTIADDDQGKLILQLCLLQEILDLLWIVVVALSTDTFNFTNLAGPSGSLDVLEVDFRIFAEVHNRSEVVVKTFKRISASWQYIHSRNTLTFEGFERLKHLDQLYRAKDIRVLGSNLDDDLKILSDIYPEHLLHASHRLFGGETTEVIN